MKLLKSYVAFEVPHKIVKQLNLVLCIEDALEAALQTFENHIFSMGAM
jgi:hypothetical protein